MGSLVVVVGVGELEPCDELIPLVLRFVCTGIFFLLGHFGDGALFQHPLYDDFLLLLLLLQPPLVILLDLLHPHF
jgi:hypothetical protein